MTCNQHEQNKTQFRVYYYYSECYYYFIINFYLLSETTKIRAIQF